MSTGNCIMVIHNLRIVDGTEYVLLAMVEKEGGKFPTSSLL